MSFYISSLHPDFEHEVVMLDMSEKFPLSPAVQCGYT